MAEARVVRPHRRQLRWDMIDLAGLLPADHRARIVWSFVRSLDLSRLFGRGFLWSGGARGRSGTAGRPILGVCFHCGFMRRLKGWGSAGGLDGLTKAERSLLVAGRRRAAELSRAR